MRLAARLGTLRDSRRNSPGQRLLDRDGAAKLISEKSSILTVREAGR